MKIKFIAIVSFLIYASSTNPVTEAEFEEWLHRTNGIYSNVFENANNYFQRRSRRESEQVDSISLTQLAQNKFNQVTHKKHVSPIEKALKKALSEILYLQEPIKLAFIGEKKLAAGQTLNKSEMAHVFHENPINGRLVFNLNNDIYWLTKAFENLYDFEKFKEMDHVSMYSDEFLFAQFSTQESISSEWNITINKILSVLDLLQKYSRHKEFSTNPVKNSQFSERDSVIGLLKQLHKDLKRACEIMSQAA